MNKMTTLAEVDRIAQLSDPIRRNYHITQSYHEISQVLNRRLGPYANWCTFATWASRQAGQTIRGEDLVNALERFFAQDPELGQSIYEVAKGAVLKGAKVERSGVRKLIWTTIDPQAAMRRASDAVARGNQKVYEEIARAFVRFLDTCSGDSFYNAANINRFCQTLRPGDPPGGQQYLRQAFTRFYQAFFEQDNKKKAELILLANLECGFHEQTRLQPEIAEAMEASVIDAKLFKDNLLGSLAPNQGWVGYVGSVFSAFFNRPSPLDRAIGAFTVTARQRIRLFLSKHLMELDFPAGMRLHLGKDLQANFPANLQHLTNPDLIVLLEKIDPTPDSLERTAATDWADLYDRLHFIGDLFRCYQESAELLSPPFDRPVDKL